LKAQESEVLENIRKKIATDDSDSQTDSSLLSVSPKELLSFESSEEKARKSQSTQKVQQEIEKLRQTLGQRKVVKELPKEVETA
jgi:wobble nucleotide-excising tRNase